MTLATENTKYRLALTGGGTAGHVWPHFALFDAANSPLSLLYASGQLDVFYYGSVSGMERDLVIQHGPKLPTPWRYIGIQNGKLRRYFSLKNIVDPLKVIWGFGQALVSLKKNKIDLLFSKGGFVAVPIVWAAWCWRIPIVIHESDVTPALATKLTLPMCTAAICAFEETIAHCPQKYRSKLKALGLPLRASLLGADLSEARKFFGFGAHDSTGPRPVLLVFGGSLGAHKVNEAVRVSLSEIIRTFDVIHVVGQGKGFATAARAEHYRQFEFLGMEMRWAYAAADIALCRAGASSIFELAALRIPMILVPLGLAQSRGDQIINAQIFTAKKWAVTLQEDALTPEGLLATLLEAHSQRDLMRQRLDSAPRADAANQIASVLVEHLSHKSAGHKV